MSATADAINLELPAFISGVVVTLGQAPEVHDP